jgi:hypothetical protein
LGKTLRGMGLEEWKEWEYNTIKSWIKEDVYG